MTQPPMQVYAILGWPVGHSRSPTMQNAAFAAANIRACYVPFSVKPEELHEAIQGLKALHVQGFNITVPHKQSVIPFLDEVSDDALTIGAVNTVVRKGDRFVGHNTDAPGLIRSIQERNVEIAGKKVLVLGAGGAARATVVGLARSQASHIMVSARRLDQASLMLTSLHHAVTTTHTSIVHWEKDLEEAFREADLMIQTTSATLRSSGEAESFAHSLPWQSAKPTATVVELVYDPLDTAVLLAARAQGLTTIDGLGMLLHQGAIAFELWTHNPAPIEEMRKALLEP